MSTSRPALVRDITSTVAHLRFPVQLTLAPLYLWGVLGAGGVWSLSTVGVFISLHFFLYAGTTLFNSYYDRDEGPISGMTHPPAVASWALPFSMLWQAVGVLIIASVCLPLTVLYGAYVVASVLYSHPRPRLKAHPYASVLLIFIFQGFGSFLAGWVASGREISMDNAAQFLAMALLAASTTIAFYPLTQVYQIDEDQARGDRTLAVVLGPVRSCRFAVFFFSLSAVAGYVSLAGLHRSIDGVVLVAGYILLGSVTMVLGGHFTRHQLLANFRRFVALQWGGSAFFTLFVLFEYLRPHLNP